MTLAECIPGRKVRFDAPLSESRAHARIDFLQPHAREGWVLMVSTFDRLTYPSGAPIKVQRVTVQYWSALRCAWLTEQFSPEQLTPAPELATDDVPGRPA